MDAQKRRTLNELIVQQTKKKNTNSLDHSILEVCCQIGIRIECLFDYICLHVVCCIPQQVKAICKQSDDYVRVAFAQLFHQLETNDSHKRFLALLLCKELMMRSKVFRQLMADQMQLFISLTIVGGALKKGQTLSSSSSSSSSTGIGNKRRSFLKSSHTAALLPPPVESAELLRSTSLECVEEWDAKYGEVYRKIHLGFKYVKEVLEIKFPNIRQRNERIARQERERQRVTQDILRSKFSTICAEFEDTVLQVLVVLKQMDVLFPQIVPNMDDILHTGGYFSDEEKEEHTEQSVEQNTIDEQDDHRNDDKELEEEWETVFDTGKEEEDDRFGLDEIIQAAGLGSSDFELTIEISNQFENLCTKDNKFLFDTLRDGLNQLVKLYEPIVLDWINVLSNVDLANAQDKARAQTMISRSIELKQKIAEVKDKCAELNIEASVKHTSLSHTTFNDELQAIVKRVMERKRAAAASASASIQSPIQGSSVSSSSAQRAMKQKRSMPTQRTIAKRIRNKKDQ